MEDALILTVAYYVPLSCPNCCIISHLFTLLSPTQVVINIYATTCYNTDADHPKGDILRVILF